MRQQIQTNKIYRFMLRNYAVFIIRVHCTVSNKRNFDPNLNHTPYFRTIGEPGINFERLEFTHCGYRSWHIC